MKRTLASLLFTLLAGSISSWAYESFDTDDNIEAYDDIDDETREELDREQDFETDTMKGKAPVINPLKLLPQQPCIYDMPYSLSGNYPHYRRLAANTALLVGGGITTMVILNFLPENSTNWNKKEKTEVPMAERYYNHVTEGPHWDGDSPIFNFILHPYAGAAYFMSARSQGFSFWYSALYSFAVSTFFWEYGFEAFMEIPSWQDLIITPVCGSILGEVFYHAKRYIVEHDYRLLGSKPLGYVAAFLCDPVNEFLGYFRGNDAHGWTKRHNMELSSAFTLTSDGLGGQAPTLSVSLTF